MRSFAKNRRERLNLKTKSCELRVRFFSAENRNYDDMNFKMIRRIHLSNRFSARNRAVFGNRAIMIYLIIPTDTVDIPITALRKLEDFRNNGRD